MAFLLVALGRLILLFQSGTVNIWTSVTESVKKPAAAQSSRRIAEQTAGQNSWNPERTGVGIR